MEEFFMEENEPIGKTNPTSRKIVWSLGLLIVFVELYNLFVHMQYNEILFSYSEILGLNKQMLHLAFRCFMHGSFPFVQLIALLHLVFIRFWPSLSLKGHSLHEFMYPQAFTLFYNFVFSLFNLFGSIVFVFESRHNPDTTSTVYHIGGKMNGITSLLYNYEENKDPLGFGFLTPVWRIYLDAVVTILFYLFLFLTQWNVLQLYLYSYHRAQEKARSRRENQQ